MLAELTRIEAGWPLAVSLAAAVTAQGLLAGRRRTLLNEALHELRRPLQALVLSLPATGVGRDADLSLQAALALERLDREINGGAATAGRAPVSVEALLAAAVGRWQERARLTGGSLRLLGDCADATVSVDRGEIAQALDNMIVNAIEHGGPRILVGADLRPGAMRVTVADSGRDAAPPLRGPSLGRVLAALTGRRRRGHGLRVARRVAAAHGGEFRLRRAESGAEATLELPLPGAEAAA